MELTDKNFNKEVIKPNKLALVMFWGSWCPVCKRMEPMLREMKKDLEEMGIKVGTINIDQNPHASAEYKVAGTPTFYIFDEDGDAIDMAVGAQTEDQLRNLVERNVDGSRGNG